jgi:dolichyl-phosphate beta-glucosyltransferase
MTASQREAAPLVSLVIPAYNEEENIRRGALQKAADYLADQNYASELIVVDDGSDDATVALVAEASRSWPFLSLLRNEHGGKARAVTTGVLASQGKYVIFSDMDQSTPVRFVEDAVRELKDATEVVIGSRLIKGTKRRDGPLLRNLLGRGFSLLVRTLLLPQIHDSQCGFKGFRREVAHELFGAMKVFGGGAQIAKGPMVTAFDVELLVLAKRRGYRIKEIPVVWSHVRTNRVNASKDAYRMFKQVMQVWLNDRRGTYDISPSEPSEEQGRKLP